MTLMTWAVLAPGCGEEPERPVVDPAPAVDGLARSSPEEIATELEILEHEIADLEAALQAGARTVPGASEPGPLLATADSARRGAREALSAGDTLAAIDSVEAAAARVEEAKRAMGLAEEWGEEIEPERP
ncbi:MAG: hypothetical protein R3199_06930 [Gemmatimonadota bacterium]|nr:hypothetical protein [Gemmatimonadota bacterium]